MTYGFAGSLVASDTMAGEFADSSVVIDFTPGGFIGTTVASATTTIKRAGSTIVSGSSTFGHETPTFDYKTTVFSKNTPKSTQLSTKDGETTKAGLFYPVAGMLP
jgi:hypothetical protein